MVENFLEQLLPDGLIVIARKGETGFKNSVCETIQDAAAKVAAFKEAGVDCYFGLGSLKEKFVLKADGSIGVRVSQNIKELKSFFIDIDVDPYNERKYASQQAALDALDTFVGIYNFPQPMIVSSGGGLHVYWPLKTAIAVQMWRESAVAFKSGLINSGLKIDPTRSADASSVLRVVGTVNNKNGNEVKILRHGDAVDRGEMISLIAKLPISANVRSPVVRVTDSAFSDLHSNLTPDFKPSKLPNILKNCQQIRDIAMNGGVDEPTWYAAIGLARHTTEPEKAALFLSRRHPEFKKETTLAKLNQVSKDQVGPTTCAKFHELDQTKCILCPKYGKITSPIQLGVDTVELPEPKVEIVSDDPDKPPETIEIPKPPHPYTRSPDGIGIMIDKEVELIYGRDFYPVRRFHDEKHDAGMTVWRVHIPHEQPKDLHIEQSMLADTKELHRLLLSQHVTIMPSKIKHMSGYMIAYIKHLQDQSKTEKLLARLGWRDDNQAFVLGPRVYEPNSVVTIHKMADNMIQDMPGLKQKGSLQGWKDTIQFYNSDGHEAHRFMLYASLGSPLFHMTGHKGASIYASGESGTGKSTVLRAINSVWGHPDLMMNNATKGGMTENAMFNLMGLFNNLPICLDDMTNNDAGFIASMALGISQGCGKRRSTRSGELAKVMDTWSLIALISGNIDAYTSLIRSRGAAVAEAMRIFQIQMTLPTTYTKHQADKFANIDLVEHYGHAGHVYIPWVVNNYTKIRDVLLKNVARVGEKANITSNERFWAAMVGAAATAGSGARKLGLLEDFPVEKDMAWAIRQIHITRKQVGDHVSTPREILAEFLESKLSETLVVSTSSRHDVRVEQEPRGALSVRIDKDTNTAMLMKSQIRQYCGEVCANFMDVQDTLEAEGILLERNSQKVLGAGTNFGRGQVRAWIVNLNTLCAYSDVCK